MEGGHTRIYERSYREADLWLVRSRRLVTGAQLAWWACLALVIMLTMVGKAIGANGSGEKAKFQCHLFLDLWSSLHPAVLPPIVRCRYRSANPSPQ